MCFLYSMKDGWRAVRGVTKWVEVDQERQSSSEFPKLVSSKSRAVNSITFHFLLQLLSLVSRASYLVTSSAFFKKYFALLLHDMNRLPRYKHGSADYKWKLFSVRLCFSFLASIKHKHTFFHIVWWETYVLAESLFPSIVMFLFNFLVFLWWLREPLSPQQMQGFP